ncbi:MAG: 6-hydroxymethylpterin diphosphokinase MptE-like protein [Poseidonibacter sp.]|uniref:motility associated factor glycosyltransferase family protein n=1 Tax=Poseidonibacter sp. TaxID=2321188 RepID=UPI00359CD44F
MEMTAEEQLHKAMMDTHHLNLLFLSEFDNELFIRVNNLSNLIGNGQYKERYFLEYIKESGDFDIYDNEKDTFLYDKNPKKFNNKAVIQTNYDLKNTINTLSQGLYNHENDGKFEIEGDKGVYSVAGKKFMNDFYNIKKELNYTIDREAKRISHIDKFMFIGTLLGRHIPKILKKIKAKTFFVCENNLEIFRLSLFVCDYSSLAVNGKQVIFSIMDDDDVFMNKFLDFYNIDVYNNSILKFFSTNYHVDNYFNRIIDRVLSVNPMSFNYYMNLDNVVYNLSRNFFKYKTLALKENTKLKTFENRPILYLGAGPSLSDNIQWVKENQDKFIIITMAASLNILYDNDIKPDIVTTLDPQYYVDIQFFSNPKLKDLLKDTIILASINTNEEVLTKLSDITNVYLYEVLASIQFGNKGLTGNSVGELTYSIISRFTNIKEMYLLGLDLALNQDTGSTHSSDYKYNKKLDIDKLNDISVTEDYSFKGDIIKVKGNLQDEVLTSRLYYGSLRFYNGQSKVNTINTFNLSNHGAYIDNTIPLKIKDLDTKNAESLNKELLKEELLNDLDSIVISKLSRKDLENINIHLDIVKKIIEKVENSKDFKTYNELNILANEVFIYIMSNKNNINYLKEIYVTYTLAFNPFISYCMLIKDKKDKVNMKKVSKIWKDKLIELVTKYKNYLESIVEENSSLK